MLHQKHSQACASRSTKCHVPAIVLRPITVQRHSARPFVCSPANGAHVAAPIGQAPPKAHGMRIRTHATQGSAAATPTSVPDGTVSVILLAGGVGKRMGASIPKQYLDLKGQPIATYSLRTFAHMREVCQVVIVCDPSWRDVFQKVIPSLPSHVKFSWALPGAERQDSVYNGLQQVQADSQLVAVHDSARPLVTVADASKCFQDGWKVGAAVLGVAVKPTIKEVDSNGLVVKTLQRSKLWEVQTPQVIRTPLLREGFELVRSKGLEVTDDVSIIEALGKPVKITAGSYTNIKVTTPDDMSVAEKFLEETQASQISAPQPVAA